MAEPMAGAGARNLRVVEGSGAHSGDLIGEYLGTLGGRSASTVDAYERVLRRLSAWVAESRRGAQTVSARSS